MKTIPKSADVVIIGGGIIGVSIAYYLSKRGINDLVLLEKGFMGEGSTGKCAGGIRSQFSTPINIMSSQISKKVFESFKDEFGLDPEFRKTGYLFYTEDRAQWDLLRNNDTLLRSMGVKADLLSPDEIRHHWPFLYRENILGGSFTMEDGYAGPHEVLQGFSKGARRLGAVLMECNEAVSIQVKNSRISSVTTFTGDRISSPVVIDAAGPYAARIASMAGLSLPVIPVRRQLFYTAPYSDIPDPIPMIIDIGEGWYMRREGKGFLLSGPMDNEPSFNQETDYEGMEWTAAQTIRHVPELERAEIAGGWAGLYSVSPDHHAIIGSFPEVEGFICANGFSGHGFQHSPVVGMLVSELVTKGKTKTLDIRQLRPTRFRENDLIQEHFTALRRSVPELGPG